MTHLGVWLTWAALQHDGTPRGVVNQVPRPLKRVALEDFHFGQEQALEEPSTKVSLGLQLQSL